MNILVDINHPAHVHLFRNFISEMRGKGHQVFITVKEIASARKLLELYKLDYIPLGKKSDSRFGKIFRQLAYNWEVLRFVKKNKITIGIGSSITIAQVSGISGMHSVIFDDDDDAVEPLMVKYGHKYADCIVSPDALVNMNNPRNNNKTVYYPGGHELAYLHPGRFIPDPSVLTDCGLSENERFFILRFNAFKAHHDAGAHGLSFENKKKLVTLINKTGKVFISSEALLEKEFEPYCLSVSPDKVHSLLAFATMFIGDSQTMTSEATVLGTPAIRSNSFVGRISCLEEEEKKYGLTYGFKPDDTDRMFQKISELLSLPSLKQDWMNKRYEMLKDKIDVTSFMVWFVENYPESFKTLKSRPGCFNLNYSQNIE
ncbi:MAG: DUF354 domain-containing protein [Bacteroidota bacterium]